MNEAYITVEDTTGSGYLKEIPHQILDEFDNTDVSIIENTEYYFVIKIVYEDYSEIQEIVSTISYIITGYQIDRFTITVNSTEFL